MPDETTFAEHAFGEESTCRELAFQKNVGQVAGRGRKKESSLRGIISYTPHYIAVTCLVADPPPARASDPLFAVAWLALKGCKLQAGAAEVRFAHCAKSLEELRLPSWSCGTLCAALRYWCWSSTCPVAHLQNKDPH